MKVVIDGLVYVPYINNKLNEKEKKYLSNILKDIMDSQIADDEYIYFATSLWEKLCNDIE